MKKRKKYPKDNGREFPLFGNTFFVASSTECTGLIPAIPAPESEENSYSDIYHIPLSKNEKTNNQKNTL